MTVDKKTLKQMEEDLSGGHDEVYDDEDEEDNEDLAEEICIEMKNLSEKEKRIEEKLNNLERELVEQRRQIYCEYEAYDESLRKTAKQATEGGKQELEKAKKKIEATYEEAIKQHLEKAYGVSSYARVPKDD